MDRRVPLQSGESSLHNMTGAAVPLLVATGLLVALRATGAVKLEPGAGPMVAGFALLALAAALSKLVPGVRQRPSDVRIDADGMRVVGGRRSGLALGWQDVLPERCALVVQPMADKGLTLSADSPYLMNGERRCPDARGEAAPYNGGRAQTLVVPRSYAVSYRVDTGLGEQQLRLCLRAATTDDATDVLLP